MKNILEMHVPLSAVNTSEKIQLFHTQAAILKKKFQSKALSFLQWIESNCIKILQRRDLPLGRLSKRNVITVLCLQYNAFCDSEEMKLIF